MEPLRQQALRAVLGFQRLSQVESRFGLVGSEPCNLTPGFFRQGRCRGRIEHDRHTRLGAEREHMGHGFQRQFQLAQHHAGRTNQRGLLVDECRIDLSVGAGDHNNAVFAVLGHQNGRHARGPGHALDG